MVATLYISRFVPSLSIQTLSHEQGTESFAPRPDTSRKTLILQHFRRVRRIPKAYKTLKTTQ